MQGGTYSSQVASAGNRLDTFSPAKLLSTTDSNIKKYIVRQWARAQCVPANYYCEIPEYEDQRRMHYSEIRPTSASLCRSIGVCAFDKHSGEIHGTSRPKSCCRLLITGKYLKGRNETATTMRDFYRRLPRQPPGRDLCFRSVSPPRRRGRASGNKED
jgi:hypothetical protein